MGALPAHAPVSGTVEDRLLRGLRAMEAGQDHEPIATLAWLAADVVDQLHHADADRRDLIRRNSRAMDALRGIQPLPIERKDFR